MEQLLVDMKLQDSIWRSQDLGAHLATPYGTEARGSASAHHAACQCWVTYAQVQPSVQAGGASWPASSSPPQGKCVSAFQLFNFVLKTSYQWNIDHLPAMLLLTYCWLSFCLDLWFCSPAPVWLYTWIPLEFCFEYIYLFVAIHTCIIYCSMIISPVWVQCSNLLFFYISHPFL